MDGPRIQQLQREIAMLPKGSLGKKRIKGRDYFYQRWYEEGKRKEKYVAADEVEQLGLQIEYRRELEKELHRLQGGVVHGTPRVSRKGRDTFATMVLTGDALDALAQSVESYRRRECYGRLRDYVWGDTRDKVFVLYGLRRTGKTTLIRQALADMDPDERAHAAIIQVVAGTTMKDVAHDLRILQRDGYRCVFVDEATLMEDFIEGAAVFSDVFAALGMRVVLSGTDSLGFMFSQDEQLYDRCILLHTTWIPYAEFEGVLGIHGIDEYLRYGGTMSMGGVHYDRDSTFATKEGTDEYVDSAIARNIQHSLHCYQDGGHFRHLRELYEAGELTSAVNRVVEDANHRFALEVLSRDFRSGDLALSARNLRSDPAQPSDVLDRVDIAAVTLRLRRILEIRDGSERTVPLADVHVREIEEYLGLLDLTRRIDVVTLPYTGEPLTRTVITQPGLRYTQVDALIQSLLQDPQMADLSFDERAYVLGRIRSEVAGRMLEELVLLHTKLALPDCEVCTVRFAVGEFDMVVFNPAAGSCRAYEIKHSDQRDRRQCRHLLDTDKCAALEHRYGPITERAVLYRGPDCEEFDIRYRNVEEYLRSVGRHTV